MDTHSRTRKRLAWTLVPALVLVSAASHADFDLTYTSTFNLTFEPDQEVGFDDLTPGTILEPGDPIAPGVTFGGVGDPAEERALVVDMGDGDLALLQINLGTEMNPDQSRIVFAFDRDVRSVGADIAAPGSFETNPNSYIYDSSSDELNFSSIGGTVIGFFGWIGTEQSRPTRFLEYQYLGAQPANALEVYGLAVLYVPEPASACAQAVALTVLSALVWRRSA